MCWPNGKAERRYAGVTHIDAAGFTADDARRVHDTLKKAGVAISGLGYYPNRSHPTPPKRARCTPPSKSNTTPPVPPPQAPSR